MGAFWGAGCAVVGVLGAAAAFVVAVYGTVKIIGLGKARSCYPKTAGIRYGGIRTRHNYL